MRPTPWTARAPRAGMQWCVIDADGKHVCECDGEDDGSVEAERIVRAVNHASVQTMVRALGSLVR